MPTGKENDDVVVTTERSEKKTILKIEIPDGRRAGLVNALRLAHVHQWALDDEFVRALIGEMLKVLKSCD